MSLQELSTLEELYPSLDSITSATPLGGRDHSWHTPHAPTRRVDHTKQLHAPEFQEHGRAYLHLRGLPGPLTSQGLLSLQVLLHLLSPLLRTE